VTALKIQSIWLVLVSSSSYGFLICFPDCQSTTDACISTLNGSLGLACSPVNQVGRKKTLFTELCYLHLVYCENLAVQNEGE